MAGKYSKLELLGAGTFGKAWLVKKKDSGRKYVVKEIKVTGLTEKEKTQSLTEVEALAKCRHLNVIKYRDAYVTQGCMNIVMEYAAGGDLHQRIEQQHSIHFPEEVIVDWFIQMCFGLKFIHGMHIIHRDLKTQNLFVSHENIIKIGDFGVARILGECETRAFTQIGTPYYLSPEICQHQPYDSQSDMWALGCVLYTLSCLSPPFDAPDFTSLVTRILTGHRRPVPSQYSSLLADLVDSLLQVNPKDRPSAEQLLCVRNLQSYVDKYVKRAMTKRDAATPTPWRCETPNSHAKSDNPAKEQVHINDQNLPYVEQTQTVAEQKRRNDKPQSDGRACAESAKKIAAQKRARLRKESQVASDDERFSSPKPSLEQMKIIKAIHSSPKLSLYKDTLQNKLKDSPQSNRSSPYSEAFVRRILSGRPLSEADRNTAKGGDEGNGGRRKALSSVSDDPKSEMSVGSTGADGKSGRKKASEVLDDLHTSVKHSYCSDDNTPEGQPLKKLRHKTDIISNNNEQAANTPSRIEPKSTCSVAELYYPYDVASNDVNKDTPKKNNMDEDGEEEEEMYSTPMEAVNVSDRLQSEDISSTAPRPCPSKEVCGFLLSSVNTPAMLPTIRAFLQGRLGSHKYASLHRKITDAVNRKHPYEHIACSIDPLHVPYVPLVIQVVQLERHTAE